MNELNTVMFTNDKKNNGSYETQDMEKQDQQLQNINNMTQIEKILPNIYLAKDFTICNDQNLQIKAFTHIIIIDKHIQELYYATTTNRIPPQKQEEIRLFDLYNYSTTQLSTPMLCFGKDLRVLNLNFGEKAYLTTVLPNCYRAVCFMDTALQSNGNILVIDCNGGEQKCITIVVAYLMYKYNLSFSAAFERFKNSYNKADLDRFYMNQLYEYEPILQVQRERSRGHSCSREIKASVLKRKNVEIEYPTLIQEQHTPQQFQEGTPNEKNCLRHDILATFNPLSQFKLNMPKNSRHSPE